LTLQIEAELNKPDKFPINIDFSMGREAWSPADDPELNDLRVAIPAQHHHNEDRTTAYEKAHELHFYHLAFDVRYAESSIGSENATFGMSTSFPEAC
jgi:hypothetical protein